MKPKSLGRLRGAVALLGLALLSCGGGSGEEIADFSEIAVGEPVMTPDPSGASAVLTVSTSVDAVCAVAFGETEAFGGLATDLDMAGTGHSEHSARLTGLTPDTRYLYRLQGVGPDGTLYQSDVFEFRTPEASGDAAPGENVAVGATVVDVSSEFSDGFAAANALDGDGGTEWSSSGDGDDAYITVDLGREVEAVAVGFRTRSMTDGTSITETFTVTVDDGEALGPFPAGIAEVAFNGQVVRFDVATSTGGNTGAVEVEVYAAP